MLKVLNFVSEKLGQHKKASTEDLQKRLDELSILNKMSIALSSGQDLYHLLRLLLEELKKLFVMDEFYIGIYNPEAETVTFPICFKENQFLEISPRNLREQPGLTGAVIFSEKTLYIPDQNDPEVIQRYQPLDTGQERSRSYIGIPLMLNNSVIGVLSVQSVLPNAYTSQQIQLLETIAAQSAIAIDKARLFSELQTELDQRQKWIAELEIKNAETETLRESVSIVAATLEKSEAVDRILDQLERVVPYNSASVQLIQDNKLVIVRGKGLDHEIGDGAWKFDINESEPSYLVLANKAHYVLYDDIQAAIPAFAYFPHSKIHSWMAVPLRIKDKLLGIIALDGNSIGQFTERHAHLAVTYANQVAIALENANLFSKLQTELLERERSEQALRESESKLRAIIENVPFDMWVSDKDNRYIMQSGESFRLAGDILGKTPDEIGVSPDIVAPWWEDYRRAMKGETVYKEVAWEVKGELRNFITTLAPVKDKENIIGYIGLNIDITERKQAEQEIQGLNKELEQRVEQRTTQLQEANQNLNQEKARLEQYSRQRELMADMTDLLQASLTMEEASQIISTHLKLLFPHRDGALYLITPSNNFEPVAIWGERMSLDVSFTTNECWGLRRGKPYRFGTRSPNPPCAHIGKEDLACSLCIPLSAQGVSLGNLHISTQNSQEIECISDEEQRFIETIADSISLAIANLRLREKLHFESIRDPLTGLFNRRYLDETLPREIHRAERNKHPISVLMFDIDHFKKFNDTFGHDAGDVVLQSVAGLMVSVVRDSDIACRYGGEEFTIILPDTPLEIAAHRAESLRHEISTMELRSNGQDLGKVTISIGVATYPQHGSTRDTLIKSADEASYKAKETGRNRVVVCQ